MFDSPYTFLALTIFLLSIPIALINALLIVGIARDRSTTNRIRWFNSIFLYFVGGNLALILMIGNFMPLIIPDEKDQIFIIFSGISINDGVWRWFVKVIYSVTIAILSYLVFIPPIAMFLRWIVYQKVLSTKWLQRSYTLTFFHMSAIPFWFFTYWFLFINEEDYEGRKNYEQRVVQLMGQKFPFIVIDSTLNLLLLIVFGTFFISTLVALLWHILFVQSTIHVQDEVAELGYQDSVLITNTFFSLVLQPLMPLSAILLIKLSTWILSPLAIIINFILCLAIINERSTDNKLRWFNFIFLFYGYCMIALISVFAIALPVFIPARGLVYIAFCGPVAWIFGEIQMRIILCVMIGIVVYIVLLPPVSLVVRWMVAMRYLSSSFSSKTMISRIFTIFSSPFLAFTAIFLFNEANFDTEYTLENHQKTMKILLAGESYPFLVMKLNISTLLLSIFGTFFIIFCLSVASHKTITTRHVTHEHIELGFHNSTMVSHTFLSMNIQSVILITLPYLFLALSILVNWQLGVRALPITFGCLCLPLTISVTLFVHFRVYRRQLGIMMFDILRCTKVSLPVAPMSTYYISDIHHEGHSTAHCHHHNVPVVVVSSYNYPVHFQNYDYQI